MTSDVLLQIATKFCWHKFCRYGVNRIRIRVKLKNKIFNKQGVFMAIKPIGERVLIESLEAETKTAGGIIIPDNAQEKPQQGKVIAVGDGTAEVKLTLKAGDKVLYGKYAGTEITYEGKKYIVMKESDVLAVIN
jgi:chaperonin GroES